MTATAENTTERHGQCLCGKVTLTATHPDFAGQHAAHDVGAVMDPHERAADRHGGGEGHPHHGGSSAVPPDQDRGGECGG